MKFGKLLGGCIIGPGPCGIPLGIIFGIDEFIFEFGIPIFDDP